MSADRFMPATAAALFAFYALVAAAFFVATGGMFWFFFCFATAWLSGRATLDWHQRGQITRGNGLAA